MNLETDMGKVLTIAIPAYNADWCLKKCLDSLIDFQMLARLDIVVIDDGSADQTASIARKYAERYPESVRLHSKANGGHGSGINIAVELARGRYFKVLDADDWILSENLPELLDRLETADADVVLTHFHTIDMMTGRRQVFRTSGIPLNKTIPLSDLVEAGRDALQCATFHGIIYRTAFYRQTGVRLSEGIFFEDHEYATLPFKDVRDVLPLDLFFYQYLIGNAAQSVADQSQVRRIGHIEQVIWSIADCLKNNPDMPDCSRRYFYRKLSDLLLSYYIVAMVKNHDKRAGRQDVRRLRRELMPDHPELVRMTARKYALALTMNFLRLSNRTLELIKRTVFYKAFYNAVRKK